MTDIVELLTAVQVFETSKDGSPSLVKFAHPLGIEAADEINRLRARVAELDATLNKYKEDELLLSRDGVHFRKAIDVVKEQSARIADLECALKKITGVKNLNSYLDVDMAIEIAEVALEKK